jgi:DNA-binding NarL/FixJ family response regulator
MITSEKQYKEAVRKIEMLGLSLSSPKKKDVPDIIEKAGRSQILELIESIKEEIREFETYKQNLQHAIEMGLINNKEHNNSQSKLSYEQRQEIKQLLLNKTSQTKIAKQYNVSPKTITRIACKMIKTGEKPRENIKLNYNDAKTIRLKLNEGAKLKDIAKEYNISIGAVWLIKSNRLYNKFTD